LSADEVSEAESSFGVSGEVRFLGSQIEMNFERKENIEDMEKERNG
jgi:hypothetical protein